MGTLFIGRIIFHDAYPTREGAGLILGAGKTTIFRFCPHHVPQRRRVERFSVCSVFRSFCAARVSYYVQAWLRVGE